MSDRSPAVAAAEERHVALAARSRRRLLDVLRSSGRPRAAEELAAAVGLHVTTARAHLRLLETAGLVVRTPRLPAGPGRPRHYFALGADGTSGEGHRQLAELLAAALGADRDGGRRRAEDAGRRWAELQVPESGQDPGELALHGLQDLFARLGFAPRRVEADQLSFRLALEQCPFRDVARAHPEVVCSLHLGLMRGALSRFGAPEAADAAVLRPFVAPEMCMAEIPAPATATRRNPEEGGSAE